jgi:hypothetical protein
LTVELKAAASPGLVSPDALAVQLGLGAFKRVLGVRPTPVRSGGSLPVLAALSDKGIPTILTGFALPDANIHSPNERLLADYIQLSIAAARALYEDLAALRG